MSSKLLEHLQSRPISSILNVTSENGNHNELKLICVLDYELEISNLYTKITAVPKLGEQLLMFHSLGSFKYFSYKFPKCLMGKKLLKCKVCQLVGPYATVIEHMIISHNLHSNAKICMWCEKTKLKVHANQNTFNQCYDNFVANQQLIDVKYPKVIKTFYKMLKKLATELHVKISRSKLFKGMHKSSNDMSGNGMVVFTSQHESEKEIDLLALETLYQKAIIHFYPEKLHEYLILNTNFNSNGQFEHSNVDSAGLNQNSVCSQLTIEVDPAQVDMSSSPSHFESPHSSVDFDSLQPPPQFEAPLPKKQPKLSLPDKSLTDKSFSDFIATTLGHIKDQQFRENAKSEIQTIVTNFLAQDMTRGITKNQSK